MDPIMFFIFLVRGNTHGHRWALENSHGVTRRGLQEGMVPSHVTPLAALLAQVGTHTGSVRRRNQWVIQSGITLIQPYIDSLAPPNAGWKFSLSCAVALIFRELFRSLENCSKTRNVPSHSSGNMMHTSHIHPGPDVP